MSLDLALTYEQIWIVRGEHESLVETNVITPTR